MRLYLLLVISTFLSKLFGFYFLTLFVLMLPLMFLEKNRFWSNSLWNISVILVIPIVYLYGFDYAISTLFIALAEEIFFRAYLMKNHSNITVSLLFVIPHLILYTDIHSLLTFFPSLIFGYLFNRTGSLVFVSVIHCLSNIMYDKLLPYLLPERIEGLLKMPLG